MSYMELIFQMGIYKQDFTKTMAYEPLETQLPLMTLQQTRWQRISHDPYFHLTGSNTSTLHSPALRYIHTLLYKTLIGCEESTVVLSTTDFTFLCTMTKNITFYLGYIVTQSILYQASDIGVEVLHIGPYITQLVRGMGQLWDTEHMCFMGWTIPLTMTILRTMRMVRHQRTSKDDR